MQGEESQQVGAQQGGNERGDRSDRGGERDPVRTLFLTGFPPDVKHRELHNLFRFFAGYEDSILKPNGVAFALFTEPRLAMEAMEALHGIQFDPDSPEPLRVEMAKANTKRKREAEESVNSEFFSKERVDKRVRKLTQPSSYQTAFAVSPQSMYGLAGYGAGPLGAYPPYQIDPFAPFGGVGGVPQRNSGGGVGVKRPHTTGGTAQPCCTLFVSNMSLDVDEGQLFSLFSRLEGYARMQIYRKQDVMNAFVQFKDLKCASLALNSLQGVSLPSSSRGPLHIEFARNEMVLKSDFTTPPAEGSPTGRRQ